MTKKLTSLLLSILMVVTLFSVSVFADEQPKEIPFDSKGIAEFNVGNKGTSAQYSLKLDKSTVLYAEALDSNYISINKIGTNGSLTLMSTSMSAIRVKLPAGDYLIETKRPNGAVLNNYKVRLILFCYEYYTKINGTVYYFDCYSSDIGVLLEENRSVTLGITPDKGYSYEYVWYNSDQKKVGTGSEFTPSEAGFYSCEVWNGDYYFTFYRTVYSNKDNLSFEDGYLSNFLVDKGSDFKLRNKATCDCGKAETGYYTSSNPVAEFYNLQYSFHMTGIAYCPKSYATLMKENFIFVNDPSSVYELKPGSKNDLSLMNYDFLDGPEATYSDASSYQRIFTFTPQETNEYTISSSGNSDAYVAVFDSNYNCIGWDDDKSGNVWDDLIFVYPSKPSEYDKNFSLTTELKAGEKYYFVVVCLSGDYNATSNFSVNFDCKKNSTPTPEPEKDGTFEDFVERLYVVALERASEPEGKAFWCEKVQDGTYDGAYCARFFLTSPEFLGKNKTDEQFVDTLYRTFFNREADDEGRAFWIKRIKESSKETVIEGFINSTEWCNICASYGVKSGAQWAKATIASKNATAFAERLYTECLGREAEEGGLKYWSLSLTNLERTGSQAAKEFFYSEEFLGKNFGNEEYVMRLYGTFMGRTPEEEGKAYWINFLNNGGSRDEVFNFFSTCPEFTEICTKYAIDR